MKNEQHTIDVMWDSGTAYDLFVSLAVLHDPEKFGLRGSWAAGVRSRLPGPEREFLQNAEGLLMPFEWIHRLPEPKNAQTVLDALNALPPEERIPTLQAPQLTDEPELAALLAEVGRRGSWTEEDLADLLAFMAGDNPQKHSVTKLRKMATVVLDMRASSQTSGELLFSALTAYYEQFFAEEEQRIAPTLQRALEEAQAQASALTVPELLEELSQGVRMEHKLKKDKLILVPSFWGTPLMIMARADDETDLYLFGARPADMSLIPGDVVPDTLYQALKALADPTRLRILRYLTEEPSTPADLARRLRLRAPTVIHHLDALRLARLVQLTLSHEGKRYAIRAEAVDRTFALLNDFLGEAEDEGPDEADE
jgi:DNA-binding transcriptional ArsR family regulator